MRLGNGFKCLIRTEMMLQTTQLHSQKQSEVAQALLDAYFEVPGMDPGIKDFLRTWSENLLTGGKDGSGDELESALNRLADNPLKKREALKALSRIGLLYDLAGLTARDNLIDSTTQSVGGVEDLMDHFSNSRMVLELLNRPVFEVVMTAHPTNVNSFETIEAMRDLGKAVASLRKNDDPNALEAFTRAMTQLAQCPALPEKKDAVTGETVPGNLTVRDETRFILHFLNNVYDGLPAVYSSFDQALSRDKEYDPLALKLKIRNSSWGSAGDKDGNSQVTAEATLEAIALHKREIFSRYRDELSRILSDHPQQEAALKPVRDTLSKAAAALEQPLDELAKLKGSDRFLSPEKFDHLTASVRTASKVNFHRLLETVETCAGAAGEAEEKKALVSLTRRMRTFRDSYSRIEYRETAEEYTRVVGLLVDRFRDTLDQKERKSSHLETTYAEMSEKKRVQALSSLMASGRARETLMSARDEILSQGPGRPYDNESPLPIAYHTLKRMVLAREFPEMMTANVLAECEAASNLLEAQFLQETCDKGNGRRPLMGIVPLFESPETMQRLDSIMDAALSNPEYRRHMERVAKKMEGLGLYHGQYVNKQPTPTQQIQIAHSDNTRRAGVPAARAFIWQGHEMLREVCARNDVNIEFFEGGSHSDPFRGGVRSISAMTNEFNLHDFMKFTFQGGDLINLFNTSGSITRLFTRNISHAAKVLGEQQLNGRTPEFDASHGKNLRSYNDVAIRALIGTLEDYQDHIFNTEALGFLLGAMEDPYNAIGSRSGGRQGSKASMKAGPSKEMLPFVSPQQSRTITFSESFQHAGIVPTWLGTLKLESRLREELAKLGLEQQENSVSRFRSAADRFSVPVTLPLGNGNGPYSSQASSDKFLIPLVPGAPVPQKVLQLFYDRSGVFRDVMDRVAYGVAMTNLDQAEERYAGLKENPLFARMKSEYRQALSLTTRTLPAQETQKANGRETHPSTENLSAEETHAMMLERHLPHLQDVLAFKYSLMKEVQDIKHKARAESDEHDPMMEALAHAGMDTVTHGILIGAQDPRVAAIQMGPRPQHPFQGKPVDLTGMAIAI